MILKIDSVKNWFSEHIGYSYITLCIGNPGERSLKIALRGGLIITAGLSDVVVSHEYVKSCNHTILMESRQELYHALAHNFRLERTEYLAKLAKISEIYKQDDGVS